MKTTTNKAEVKLSPTEVELSDEQRDLIDRILHFVDAHALNEKEKAVFTITGDAGTGKSVVLSRLFYELQLQASDKNSRLYGLKNYFLVNHPEVLKVYQSIAGTLNGLHKNQYMRPTSFINQHIKQKETADIVIIDEAHLLLSRPDHYNHFYGENQLQSVIELAKVVVIVFDPNQIIKTKSYWSKPRLDEILSGCAREEYHLKRQFRMNAKEGLVKWIDAFTESQTILPLHKEDIEGYDFRLFDDAQAMYEEIIQRDKEVGLSRITATINYPSRLDGGKHYVDEGLFHLPWDQYNYSSTPWAELPSTINEVGSIYTVQGFDLNYIGIILGPSLSANKDNPEKIKVDISKVTDKEIFKKRDDISSDEELTRVKLRLFLNSLNVLMKRGRMGLYLFAHDKQLSDSIKSCFDGCS